MNFAIKTNKLVRILKIRGAKLKEDKILAALKDVDLELRTGELFGLLGPNGAGKTMLIKILTILKSPSLSKAWVIGFDVLAESEQVRPRINMVSGGESSGYGLLIVHENLWMFSHSYGLLSKEVNRRIKHLLDIVGMGDRFNNKSLDLSTGLRQKKHIWFLGEAVGGVLYLFSGAIFPIDVLAPILRPIGYLIPITYWLELLHRSLVRYVIEVYPTLSRFNNMELMGILMALTVVFGLLSIVVFRWCDQRARERDLIDMVTDY